MNKRNWPRILALALLLALSARMGFSAVKQTSRDREKLFSGVCLKLGLMTSPDADGLGNQWIVAVGFDRMVLPWLAWGLEFQPYVRSASYTDFQYTDFSGNLFLNLKGGYPVGKLVKAKALQFLNPLKVYAGLGAGVELSVTSFTIQGDNTVSFKARFAWHMFFGIEYALKKIGLIFEIQPAFVTHSELDPSTISYFYIMAGIRL